MSTCYCFGDATPHRHDPHTCLSKYPTPANRGFRPTEENAR